MEFELTAGEAAKTLKVWEKTGMHPTNVEIILEMGRYKSPDSYELYVFRYADRVELRQDLFLLSDRGAERVEKLIDGRLTEVKIPTAREEEREEEKAAAKIEKPKPKIKKRENGFSR